MNRPYSKRKMLFITSMPASHTNAIGIRAVHYADALAAEWHHCYWDYGMGMREVPNSYCLNSARWLSALLTAPQAVVFCQSVSLRRSERFDGESLDRRPQIVAPNDKTACPGCVRCAG